MTSVKTFPELAYLNKDRIAAAGNCGCYFCLQVFNASDIQDYEDEGRTGVCPNCGMDSLLPGITDAASLRAGLERWFTRKKL